MSDNQQRRAFEEPHAGSGGVTGAAVAALAHGGVPAADDELVDESAIAAAPAGVGPARAAHLPAGADPDAVRDWFELETIVDLPAPALSFAEAEAAAADYRRAARAENTKRAYRAGVAAFTEWCACIPATASRLPVSAELARASRSPTHKPNGVKAARAKYIRAV